MSEAATELGESLDAARSFAIANDLTSWGDWFGKAIVAAVSPDPAVPYNPDIAPDGALTLERRQLLASAVQAWVFGGMGSWNDVWLEDESQMGEMAHVSDRLYGAVMDALVAVTNNQ